MKLPGVAINVPICPSPPLIELPFDDFTALFMLYSIKLFSISLDGSLGSTVKTIHNSVSPL